MKHKTAQKLTQTIKIKGNRCSLLVVLYNVYTIHYLYCYHPRFHNVNIFWSFQFLNLCDGSKKIGGNYNCEESITELLSATHIFSLHYFSISYKPRAGGTYMTLWLQLNQSYDFYYPSSAFFSLDLTNKNYL